MRAPVEAGIPLVGTSGSGCTYTRKSVMSAADQNKNVDLETVVGQVPSKRSIVVGKVVSEPALGRDGCCVATPPTATVYPSQLTANGRPAYVYVGTDSCTDGVTLVKDALASIS